MPESRTTSGPDGPVASSTDDYQDPLKETLDELAEMHTRFQGPAEEMDAFAITNATVWTVSGETIEDATVVVTRMAKYKNFFLNIMMTEELCLPVPEEDDNINSLKDGLVMFASFAFFGMLPILGFALVLALALEREHALFDLELDVLGGHAGQLHVEEELVVLLVDVDQRRETRRRGGGFHSTAPKHLPRRQTRFH